MSTPTNSFPTVTSVAAGDTFMVNAAGASSKITVTNAKTSLAVPAGANPTASVGTAAVNGAATTFLRSDGAPAISQAIVPTWSGIHTFSATPRFKAGGFNDLSIELGAAVYGITNYVSSGINSVLVQLGNNIVGPGFIAVGLALKSGDFVRWSNSSGDPVPTPDTGLARSAAGVVEVNDGTAGAFGDVKVRELRVDGTITASGQTGSKTINKGSGTVRFPSGVNPALTLTNSLITDNTLVFTQVRADILAGVTIGQSAQASGTITLTALATLAVETEVAFFLVEPS